jgi:hypothetical protein
VLGHAYPEQRHQHRAQWHKTGVIGDQFTNNQPQPIAVEQIGYAHHAVGGTTRRI